MVSDKTPAKQQDLKDGALKVDTNHIQYRKPDGSLGTEAHDKSYMELTLKSGKHSDLIKQLLKQRIEQRAKEFPRWHADAASGVRAVWIESRFWYDRERLLPDFDDDWRRYRARYLHSLELDPREPVHCPEYERSLLNPIRRFYMKGGDFIENQLVRRFVKNKYESAMYRVVITRGFMLYLIAITGYYYFRFNHRKWYAWGGPDVAVSSPIIDYNHPDFPFEDYRTHPTHHYDLGFTRRNIYKDLRDFEDSTVVL